MTTATHISSTAGVVVFEWDEVKINCGRKALDKDLE